MVEVEALIHTVELLGTRRYNAINNITLPVCEYITKLTF